MRRFFLTILCCITCLAASMAANAREITVTYPSIDQYGDSITLSGMICIPDSKPKGVILIPHYTIMSKYEAPSIKPTGEAFFFKDDYILVMPDYIGFGVTEELDHPYLAGELTARNCIDMLAILSQTPEAMNSGIALDSIYIVGYSQGGASAMWILKVLEEEYADRYHVKACFAGGGPYDVAVTYDDALTKKKVFAPVVVPLMVVGTDAAYDLHIRREDFFTPAMQEIYDTYVSSKEYSAAQLFFKFRNHHIDHWMSDLAMDPSQPDMQRKYEGLKRSRLVRYPLNERIADQEVICTNWRPKAPLYVFHSTKDNVVTIRCAEHLRQCLGEAENITYDFKNYGSHTHASKWHFFPNVQKMLKKM